MNSLLYNLLIQHLLSQLVLISAVLRCGEIFPGPTEIPSPSRLQQLVSSTQTTKVTFNLKLKKEIVSYLTRGQFFISPTQIPHGKFVRWVELIHTPNNPMVAPAAKTSCIVFTPCPPDERVLGEALWLYFQHSAVICMSFSQNHMKMLSSFQTFLEGTTYTFNKRTVLFLNSTQDKPKSTNFFSLVKHLTYRYPHPVISRLLGFIF